MTRREFLYTTAAVVSITPFVPGITHGQDVEYIRAVERAQAARPAAIGSSARIAPTSEVGTPLTINGRAFGAQETAPLANAIVFAYHTDRGGLYDHPGRGPHSWRLKGWTRTDRDGRFQFHTIRPGSYPNSRNPAHVHFTIFMESGERYHAGELQFADDPLIPESQRTAITTFGSVRPVRQGGGGQIVDVNLRIEPRNRF